MKRIEQLALGASAAILLFAFAGCTVIGAGIGAAAGSGSAVGVAGGAVIGGVVGYGISN